MITRTRSVLLPRSVLQRTLAGLLSATILLLSILAVSPAAHERLHTHSLESDHTCAVTLFAQGVTTPLTHIDVPLPFEAGETSIGQMPERVAPISPRYLLRPLRGPPLS